MALYNGGAVRSLDRRKAVAKQAKKSKSGKKKPALKDLEARNAGKVKGGLNSTSPKPELMKE
jgi:hypothetical protein